MGADLAWGRRTGVRFTVKLVVVLGCWGIGAGTGAEVGAGAGAGAEAEAVGGAVAGPIAEPAPSSPDSRFRLGRTLYSDDFQGSLANWVIESEEPARVRASGGVLDIRHTRGADLVVQG